MLMQVFWAVIFVFAGALSAAMGAVATGVGMVVLAAFMVLYDGSDAA